MSILGSHHTYSISAIDHQFSIYFVCRCQERIIYRRKNKHKNDKLINVIATEYENELQSKLKATFVDIQIVLRHWYR